MSTLRKRAAAFLACLLLLTACAREAPPPEEGPTLADLRQRVSAAFDGTASSAARRTAAEDAVRMLLGLLEQTASYSISDEDWSASPRPGVDVMVRHLELDKEVHLYTLALPGRSLVDEAERVAVQIRRGGTPRAHELGPLPAGRLEAAQLMSESGSLRITLVMRTEENEGFIAHFAGPGGGPFALVTDAFDGMAGTYGTVELRPEDGVLHVTVDGERWAPAWDESAPGKLALAPEVFLKWEGRFQLYDESRFDAFTLLSIATDPARWCRQEGDCPEAVTKALATSTREAAAAAWNLATARLTQMLGSEEGLSDAQVLRLPAGSRMFADEGRALSARLLTVPAPGPYLTDRTYNAVQFRAGGGMPLARVLDLPGTVESAQVMAHNGNPALLLVVDESAGQGQDGTTEERRDIYLLRLDAGNEWRKASDWVGYVTRAPYWYIGEASPDGVTIAWDAAALPAFRVQLEEGEEPGVMICPSPEQCHALSWVDGRLHFLPLLTHYMGELTRPHAEEDLVWAAGQMAQFLTQVDPAALPGSRLSQLVDPDGTLGIRVIDAGENTRLVTLPASPGGLQMAIIHAPGQAELVKVYDGLVTEWEAARIVRAGDEKRLLVLGRSDRSAVLLAYRMQNGLWAPADPLDAAVDRLIGFSMRVMFTPGAERPARGIVVRAGDPLTTTVTDSGARFCEGVFRCATYRYDGSWKLE